MTARFEVHAEHVDVWADPDCDDCHGTGQVEVSDGYEELKECLCVVVVELDLSDEGIHLPIVLHFKEDGDVRI